MSRGKTVDELFRMRLREIRKARGLTQQGLGRGMVSAGYPTLTKNRISEIERGSRKVALAEALAIASVLGTSLGDLTNPGTGTVQLTMQAGLNEALWRDRLAYAPSGPEASKARDPASREAEFAHTMAARALELRNAGARAETELSVIRVSIGTPALTVTPVVAGVAAASHAPSVPPQVPD